MLPTRPAPIRLVLFDMDDVLCAYDQPGRVLDLARRAGRTPEAIHAALWTSGFEDEADMGMLDSETYLAGFAARLGMPFSREDWIANRRHALTPWPEMLALAAAISRHATVAILTNNGHLTGDSIDVLFPGLQPVFSGRILTSAALGVQKPEPEAYRRAIARLGFGPAETLFTDDRRDNVDGAIAAGLHGHVHAGADALRAKLAALWLVLGD